MDARRIAPYGTQKRFSTKILLAQRVTMSIPIPYMGTKTQLANEIADAIDYAQPGPVLDAFSGMCSIGVALAGRRNIWNNDIQIFSSEVARTFFTSKEPVMTSTNVSEILYGDYQKNKKSLASRFQNILAIEKSSLEMNDLKSISYLFQYSNENNNCNNFRRERKKLSLNPKVFPYRLATITFSIGYFSLAQCIEIDSIRFAVDQALKKKKISRQMHRWIIVGLCLACKRVANTTGHFAQYLHPNTNNFMRIQRQFHRSVWSELSTALTQISPVGTSSWRQGNFVTNKDSIQLLNNLKRYRIEPAVIYADPPYTTDHYSRYYHVLETLIHYDYPPAIGKGRYRPDRFTTPFSLKSKVVDAFGQLAKGVAKYGAELILSYPTNGLLLETNTSPREILFKYFSNVRVLLEIPHSHSTMGASKGAAKSETTEMIYWAQP